MPRYGGISARIYINGTAVVGLADWTVDMSNEQIEVTAFGDTNKTYVQGFPDLKGTFSGFWDDTEDAVWTATQGVVPVYLSIYPSLTASSKYLYGPAWLSASLSAGAKDAVKTSGTFTASESWTIAI